MHVWLNLDENGLDLCKKKYIAISFPVARVFISNLDNEEGQAFVLHASDAPTLVPYKFDIL